MSNEESLHYRCILSYYGGTTMLNGLFENVMTDVSGKVRLESEDPRWIQLFSAKCIPNLVEGTDIAWFGDRLIEHNPVTGNLVQLLEQTATRLQQVSARKSAPASHLVEQCCVALYLSTLLMHHVITSVPPHAVRLLSSRRLAMYRNVIGILFIVGQAAVPIGFVVRARSQHCPTRSADLEVKL